MGVFIGWPPSDPVQSQCKTREWVALAAERVLIAMLNVSPRQGCNMSNVPRSRRRCRDIYRFLGYRLGYPLEPLLRLRLLLRAPTHIHTGNAAHTAQLGSSMASCACQGNRTVLDPSK